MSLYRIKQFYWSLVSRVEKEDIKFVSEYLNAEEKELFFKLSTYEQKHCINVAQDVIKECKKKNIKGNGLVKAALLHDIGKIFKKLNPIEKSVVVVLDSLTKGRLKRLRSIKKVDVYYNHAEKGYKLLKNKNCYDEKFLYIIKNHHNNFIVGDSELDMLRDCDSRN